MGKGQLCPQTRAQSTPAATEGSVRRMRSMVMTRQDADLPQQDPTLRREQERHAALVRATYATLARGDIAALAPALAAQAVAHEYDGSHLCATYQGRRAILARLQALAPSYWDAARVRVHTVAAAGPLIAAIATWQGTS